MFNGNQFNTTTLNSGISFGLWVDVIYISLSVTPVISVSYTVQVYNISLICDVLDIILDETSVNCDLVTQKTSIDIEVE